MLPGAGTALLLFVLAFVAFFLGLRSYTRVRQAYGWTSRAANRYGLVSLALAMAIALTVLVPPGRALLPWLVLAFLAWQLTPAVLQRLGYPPTTLPDRDKLPPHAS